MTIQAYFLMLGKYLTIKNFLEYENYGNTLDNRNQQNALEHSNSRNDLEYSIQAQIITPALFYDIFCSFSYFFHF